MAVSIEETGLDPAFGTLLGDDDECVCPGHVWPGSVLLEGEGRVYSGSTRLAIVDWKIMRRDPRATDVGQFAADAYCLDWFWGGRSLCGAFLTANMGNRMQDRRFVKEVAVHFGTNLGFWTARVGLGDEEAMRGILTLCRCHTENGWRGIGWSRPFRNYCERRVQLAC